MTAASRRLRRTGETRPDTASMLADLRGHWTIDIHGEVGGWSLRLIARSDGRTNIYRGDDLARLAWRAWAGEKGDS
jgi:hypothetical protein